MYPHQSERLDAALEAFGVDALVATSAADVAYLTGFWSFSRSVYPADIAAVYSKAGTALVIPTIDAPAFAAGDGAADHVACYGRFFVNLAERADEHAHRAARLAAEPTETAAEALARVLEALGLRATRVARRPSASSTRASASAAVSAGSAARWAARRACSSARSARLTKKRPWHATWSAAPSPAANAGASMVGMTSAVPAFEYTAAMSVG